MIKSRYKKYRYEISLWKNLAMKISLWKNLAMKSRYMKNGVKTVVKKYYVGVKTPCEMCFLRISNTLGNQHGEIALFRTVFATPWRALAEIFAAVFTQVFTPNLAMKFSL